MLVNLGEILNMAEKGGFAVPAFNVYNMETVMGITAAAEEAKAPVIIRELQQAIYQTKKVIMLHRWFLPRRRKRPFRFVFT